MALIVHKRADGSLFVDPRGGLPDSHSISVDTLGLWGVSPPDPVTFVTGEGEVTYTFAGFDRDNRKNKEPFLIYEREPADG